MDHIKYGCNRLTSKVAISDGGESRFVYKFKTSELFWNEGFRATVTPWVSLYLPCKGLKDETGIFCRTYLYFHPEYWY